MGTLAVVVALLIGACEDASVGHPLDDSEGRPADAETALSQAQRELDDVADSVLDGVAHDAGDWSADGGCGTNPESTEQGDVSRILYRSFPSLADGATPSSVVASAKTHWEKDGHTVGPGAPNMARQAVTRIDGIGFSAVETPPGVELRAFLPCFPEEDST